MTGQSFVKTKIKGLQPMSMFVICLVHCPQCYRGCMVGLYADVVYKHLCAKLSMRKTLRKVFSNIYKDRNSFPTEHF